MVQAGKNGAEHPHRRSLFKEMTVLILALVAITLFEASQNLISAWRNYSYAEATVDANSLVDIILQAAQNLSFERGRTNLLLNSTASPRPSDFRFLAERRSSVNSGIEALIKDDSNRPDISFPKLASSYTAHQELRKKVDAAIVVKGRPGEWAGNRKLSEAWFAESSALIDDLVDEATFLAFADRNFRGSFRGLSRIKIDSFRLRLDLGSEATRIAAAVASGLPLDEARRGEILMLRGRCKANWDAVKLGGKMVGDSRVSAAIDRVQREYFEKFQPLQDKALESLAGGRHSGPSAAYAFADASVTALNSLSALLDGLTAETGAEAVRLLAVSRADFLRQSLISLVAILLGVLSALFVSFRLLAPIRRIGEQLENLAEGRLDAEFVEIGPGDEMSAAHEALLDFRHSLQERRKLVEKLEKLSNSDTLTGLANRRRLDEALHAEWLRAMRSRSSLAFVMMDIDYFKAFNDARGHLAGDECLRTVARTIAAQVRRPGDLAARFGGEEFVVVLPGLDIQRAIAWAEDLRRAVEALDVLSDSGEERVGVTISCGVAALFPTREMSVSDLIGVADAALYRAKAAGRNRVEAGRIG